MGSVSMVTKQLLFLLLIHILVCAGQELGSKSRFDAILSKFGFGENPVPLKQATPSFAIDVTKVEEPVKKEEVHDDKKKFSKALQKFGFESTSKSKEHLIAKDKRKKKPVDNLETRNKGKDIPHFGLKKSGIPAFPPILLNGNINQPQLVQVVTSTFAPKHQITPRSSKQKKEGDHLTKQLQGKHQEEFQKVKTVKKLKGERKDRKQNIGVHVSPITTFSDPTLFVTPKSKQKTKTKKPLPNPKPTKNIDKQHLKTKHQNQPQDHLSKSFVNRELNTVDFGELQLTTQKPRHSRQQDLKDKNNALAALFNVAGGAGKSKSSTPKHIQKKKKKLKKTTNLTENNVLREGLKQSTRGKINKQPSNKSKLTKQSEVITKTFKGGSKITRKGKPSKRLPNKSDPLASLFSLIKEDGKGKNKPKTQKSSQTRKSNVPAITSERSQIQSSQRLS